LLAIARAASFIQAKLATVHNGMASTQFDIK